MLVLDENLPARQRQLLRDWPFLKHPAFGPQARRMGTVARVHAEGIG
jgi:hypothetical protein